MFNFITRINKWYKNWEYKFYRKEYEKIYLFSIVALVLGMIALLGSTFLIDKFYPTIDKSFIRFFAGVHLGIFLTLIYGISFVDRHEKKKSKDNTQ